MNPLQQGAISLPFIAPQLCQPSAKLPGGPRWSYEQKFDGYRAVASVTDAGDIRIFTRRGHDWTNKFPRLVASLRCLDLPAVVLDGELVALGPDGHTDFRRLTAELHHGGVSSFVGFDLLELRGKRLMAHPLEERRQHLHQLLPFVGSGVVAAPVHQDGAGLLSSVELSGGEGVVAKDIAAPYCSGGRPPSWQKIKLRRRVELVVIGWRPDARGNLQSIGIASADGPALRSRGWVGSGFSAAERATLPAIFARHEFTDPPMRLGRAPSGARWLRPVLRAELRIDTTTGDGSLRGATFLGLRTDLLP